MDVVVCKPGFSMEFSDTNSAKHTGNLMQIAVMLKVPVLNAKNILRRRRKLNNQMDGSLLAGSFGQSGTMRLPPGDLGDGQKYENLGD